MPKRHYVSLVVVNKYLLKFDPTWRAWRSLECVQAEFAHKFRHLGCIISWENGRFQTLSFLAIPFLASLTSAACQLFFQSLFGFGQSTDIFIDLENSDKRKQVEVRNEEGRKEKLLLFYDGETISGKVSRLWGSFPWTGRTKRVCVLLPKCFEQGTKMKRCFPIRPNLRLSQFGVIFVELNPSEDSR